MSNITSVGSPPVASTSSAVPVASTSGVARTDGTVVTPDAGLPSNSISGKGAPVLLPPAGGADYAGASSVMSAYTALIILTCEANRENYATNRTMIEAQVKTRVDELKTAASQRMKGAIISLVMGVIGAGVGIGGGIKGMHSSAKGIKKLEGIKTDQLELKDIMQKQGTLPDEQIGKQKGKTGTQKTNAIKDAPGIQNGDAHVTDKKEQNLPSAAKAEGETLSPKEDAKGVKPQPQPTSAAETQDKQSPGTAQPGEKTGSVPPEISSKVEPSGDKAPAPQKNNVQDAKQEPAPQPAQTAGKDAAPSDSTKVAEEKKAPDPGKQAEAADNKGKAESTVSGTMKTQEGKTPEAVPPSEEQQGVEDDHAVTEIQNAESTAGDGSVSPTPEQLGQQQNINLDLRVVEAKTARTQNMGIMFSAIKDLFNTAGQTGQAAMSAQADVTTAEAEETQGSIELTRSNMQQYQELMGKFNQILADLLEAENKARSAAAQA